MSGVATGEPTTGERAVAGARRAGRAPRALPRRGLVDRRDARRRSSTGRCAPRPTPTVQHLVGDATVARHATPRSTPRRSGSSPRSPTPGSSPATSSRSSSRTGERPSSRSTASRWAATCSCRSCTSTDPRKCASSSPQSGARAYISADRFGHVDYLDIVDGAAPDELPDLELHIVVGSADRAAARARCGASDGTSSTRPRRPTCDRRRRSRRRVRARLHVGHDERPEGRDAHAPDAARRARAHRGVDHARARRT